MFLLAEPRPLSAACYYARPLYLDVCFRLGLDKRHTSEAFQAACRYGPEWVVDRLLTYNRQDQLVCCCELGLWAACAGGQLAIVKKMLHMGATMVKSGLTRISECSDPQKARDVYEYLYPLIGTRTLEGDRYF